MAIVRKTAQQKMAAAYRGPQKPRPNNWKSQKAGEYKNKLLDIYGKPDVEGKDICIWNDGEGKIIRTVIKDEVIPHAFPMPHTDFVYSTIVIPAWAPKDGVATVPPDVVKTLAGVSGSIIIDGLKGEITARCGMLIKNGVTLGFVEDFVAGKIPAAGAKDEYARRIKADIAADWFPDLMEEKNMAAG